VAHGSKNYIPEGFIPGFFDLAVWGHEHECRIDPEQSSGDEKTYIIQPGSSVATSLCEGERRDKYVGVLSINRRRFRIQKHKLQTVRPMLLDDIDLAEVMPKLKIGKNKEPGAAVETYVQSRVELMLSESTDKLTGHPDQPTEPLVRLRIFHENVNESFHPVRFAQKFTGRIINEDIVTFKRCNVTRDANGEMKFDDMDDIFRAGDHTDTDLDSHVEAIVESFFRKAREGGDNANILEVLSEKGLSEGVKACVEKDDRDAIAFIIETQVEKICEYLSKNAKPDADDEDGDDYQMLEEVLKNYRQIRWANPDKDEAEVSKYFVLFF
jgi:double-strand break repair protein MRE11